MPSFTIGHREVDMARDKLILRWGDRYNPEKRCGQPKLLKDGRRMLHTWYTY